MKRINQITCVFIMLMILSIGHTSANTLENKSVVSLSEQFSKAQIIDTIEGIIEILKTEYIYPEHIEKSVLELKKISQEKLRYYVNDKPRFIREIGELLRRTSQDGYIELLPKEQAFVLGDNTEYQYQQRKSNFAFEHARLLEGNIGYIKINHFFQNIEAEAVAEKAFDNLKETDALIIDIREAADGSFEFAQYLMSYFIEPNTLLSEMRYQRNEQQFDMYSLKGIGNSNFKRNLPVYILTSAFVTSAGEFFSYTMQQLNKAVIVGEPTMGVASWSQNMAINDEILITLPVAIPINPITHTNWEETGVIPDFEAKSDASFALAFKLAKATLEK